MVGSAIAAGRLRRQARLVGWIVVALAVPQAAVSGDVLSGRVLVLDGDTLNVRGRVVGLEGISAPDLKHACLDAGGRSYPCGLLAAQALAAHIGSAIIACEPHQTDQHGRILATCRKDAEDLGAWMTRQGYATADRHASLAYVADEQRAWAKRRGLWAGAFDDPTNRQRDAYSASTQFVTATPDGPRAPPLRQR